VLTVAVATVQTRKPKGEVIGKSKQTGKFVMTWSVQKFGGEWIVGL
jgi:hypothetical protein